jgi:hypothetical protein
MRIGVKGPFSVREIVDAETPDRPDKVRDAGLRCRRCIRTPRRSDFGVC